MKVAAVLCVFCAVVAASIKTDDIIQAKVFFSDLIGFSDSLYQGDRQLGDVLPPRWKDIKDLSSFPVDQESGAYIVDAWDYLERMALYKYLIENVQSCHWENSIDMAAEESTLAGLNPGSILWGLPLQHGWQFSSKRLFSVGSNDSNTTTIDQSAWWADMNYYLSIIPYLGAVEAGVAPNVQIKSTSNNALFCSSYLTCPSVIDPWVKFFKLVTETAESCDDKTTNTKEKETEKETSTKAMSPNTPLAYRLDFNITSDLENLLSSLWHAHLQSIGTALPLFEDNLKLLPTPEMNFGRSWAGLVDFIAACNFKCNMATTDVLQRLLPPHVLQEGEHPPFIKDISHLQNRAVFLIDAIYVANSTSDGLAERIWDYSMCLNEESRSYGREMITLGIYRPVILVEDMEKIVAIAKEAEETDNVPQECSNILIILE